MNSETRRCQNCKQNFVIAPEPAHQSPEGEQALYGVNAARCGTPLRLVEIIL